MPYNKVKITLSSINNTVFDYARNTAALTQALQQAQADDADVHLLSALPLTGPGGQGNYQFQHTGDESLAVLRQFLANQRYLNESERVTLISFPFYHRDKDEADPQHPFYLDQKDKSQNRPFYATAIIRGQHIIGIELASELGYTQGGPYDARYFAAWPKDKQFKVDLGWGTIPVGHVPFSINGSQYKIAATHLPDASYLTSVDALLLTQPHKNKPSKRNRDHQQLGQAGGTERIVVHVNPLGSDSGDVTYAGDSSLVYGNNVLAQTPVQACYAFAAHHSQTHTVHVPINNTQLTDALQVRARKMTSTDVVHQAPSAPISEESRTEQHQKIVRESALWLRDYLLKTKQQGFVLSMSDGMHSYYTAHIVSQSIDLAIAQAGGLRAYLDDAYFGHLRCKTAVLAHAEQEGELAGIQLLKQNMLTCVYMPDKTTSLAERAEIKQWVTQTIGGKFHVAEIEPVVTANMDALIQAGINAEALMAKDDVRQAALARARVTEAGMFGNMFSQIALSTTDATDVAMGRLHAGGKGQEGPIGVTLGLHKTRIAAIVEALGLPAPSLSADEKKINQRYEAILKLLIEQKRSPLATYEALVQQGQVLHAGTSGAGKQGDALWPFRHTLVADIEMVCKQWSIAQPKRVALASAPNLGYLGNNVDRYRSVRTTRDSQYFYNGLLVLKAKLFCTLTDNESIENELTSAVVRHSALRNFFLSLPAVDMANSWSNFDPVWQAYQTETAQLQLAPTHAASSPTVAQGDSTYFALKAAVVNLEQTMFDYVNNVSNILEAIKEAEQNHVDVLLLPELCLTGYFGDADFDWINSQAEANSIYQQALYIAQQTQGLHVVVSMGLPVWLPDFAKPFVGQALIHNGKIISISLKSMQPDGGAEYEAMHFIAYDVAKHGRVQNFKLPGTDTPIPVGKPITTITDRFNQQVPLYHEQCAEAWPGLHEDGTYDQHIQASRRAMLAVARQHPGLVVLNPSGSKNEPSYDKSSVRSSILTSAMAQAPINAYLYANAMGDDNGHVGSDGDAQLLGKDIDGQDLHTKGTLYSLAQRNFTSTVFAIPKSKPHSQASTDATVKMTQHFNPGQSAVGECITGPELAKRDAPIDNKTREYEQITRATAMWALNTLRHHQKQCFVISLSGGADSTLGAVQVTQAIDLYINEHTQRHMVSADSEEDAKQRAVASLFARKFAHLTCKDAVLSMSHAQGADAAIKAIKDHVLVCVYLPTDNSSEDTLRSARTLIQGGVQYQLDEKGHFVKDNANQPIPVPGAPALTGIGGRFHVVNLQKPMDAFTLAYAGKKPDATASGDDLHRIHKQIVDYSEGKLREEDLSGETLAYVGQLPPTWLNKAHDLAKQNVQPRLRSIAPWLLAEQYDGYPLFTSNLSEAAAGYSTWAGDTSLGYENGLGGIFKSDVRDILKMYEKAQLCSLKPISGLYYVNHLEPSAELRPLIDGKYAQTDEADLMPYNCLDRIVLALILQKNSPLDVYKHLKDTADKNGVKIWPTEAALIANIHKACWLYTASQFKRTGGGNTPYLGKNLDPHLSEATTLFSGMLANARVALNLHYLHAQLGEGERFDQKYGLPMQQLNTMALMDAKLRDAIIMTPIEKLADTLHAGVTAAKARSQEPMTGSVVTPMGDAVGSAQLQAPAPAQLARVAGAKRWERPL